MKDLPSPGKPSSADRSRAQADAKSSAKVSPKISQVAASGSEPRLNVSKAVAYAKKWTKSPYAGDSKNQYNPDYPHFSNNCANFVSQILDQSTWSYRQGNSFQHTDTSVWTPNLRGIRGASYTWSSSHYLINFVGKQSAAYQNLTNIWNARAGDLLFTDWDPNGRADGQIDHVMFVSGRTSGGEPRITQKNSNRHNILLSASISNAKKAGHTKIVWYGKSHK